MENQMLLYKLGKMNETDRLVAIKEKAEYIFDDIFISFMSGQLAFAKSIENGTGYFDKVYKKEDSGFLKFLESEMKIQSETVLSVFNSIRMAAMSFDDQTVEETVNEQALKQNSYDQGNEFLPCYSCNELAKRNGLCNACVAGHPPTPLTGLTLEEKTEDNHIQLFCLYNLLSIKKHKDLLEGLIN